MAKQEKIIGLVKFFSNESYLEDLLAGKFYCNAPEFYRKLEASGVGDRYESCGHDYQAGRDPKFSLQLRVDGRSEILNASSEDDLVRFSMLLDEVGSHSWLQSWFVLHYPNNQQELDSLIADIAKIKKEFGRSNLFLPAINLREFFDRLTAGCPHKIRGHRVSYSDDRNQISDTCKLLSFEYQREFRFLFGVCDLYDEVPLQFQLKRDLKDLLTRNADLKMIDKLTGHVWFDLQEL